MVAVTLIAIAYARDLPSLPFFTRWKEVQRRGFVGVPGYRCTTSGTIARGVHAIGDNYAGLVSLRGLLDGNVYMACMEDHLAFTCTT